MALYYAVNKNYFFSAFAPALLSALGISIDAIGILNALMIWKPCSGKSFTFTDCPNFNDEISTSIASFNASGVDLGGRRIIYTNNLPPTRTPSEEPTILIGISAFTIDPGTNS